MAVAGPPTRSIEKLIVSPDTEVTVTLTSKASSPLVALQMIDWPCSPFRSVGQSELSVPSWLLICSSTLSSVATLPHAVRATAVSAVASIAANRPNRSSLSLATLGRRFARRCDT